MKTAGFLIFAIVIASAYWLERGSGRSTSYASKAESAVSIDATSIDMGNIAVNQIGKAIFHITNRSNRSVHIDRVVPECGCLKIDGYDPDILPRASRNIAVSITMNEALAIGLSKGLVLVLTAGRTENIPLHVTGKSVGIHDAAVFPAHLAFGPLRVGSTMHKSLYLVGDAKAISSIPSSIELITPREVEKRFVFEEENIVGAAPTAREIDVELRIGSETAPGVYQASLKLENNDKNEMRISIPVTYTVSGEP